MFLTRASWLLVVGALLAVAPAALAQDETEEVVTRLKRHGGLSGGAAAKLAKQVSKAMSRSADMTNSPNDPLRVRVSVALTGAPQPSDTMSVAKVRLRLYAGLTPWALDSLFRPAPGGIASCTRDLSLSTKECTALLAAGGQISTGEVAAAASGTPAAAPVASAPVASAPVAAAPAGGSRFGRFSSGYATGGGSAPPAQAPTTARPAPTTARPVATPAPAAGGTSTKDAYAARRAAYLEKQRAKMNKPAPGAASAAPAAAAEAAPEEAPADEVASAPAAAKPSASAKAAAAPEPEAPAEPASKPQLDNDFLDGLLDDPLGKK